jgi:hypothetical protein
MPRGNAQSAALTVLTIAEVPNMYSGLLPSLFTISTFSGGDAGKVAHTRRWIRHGEIQATGMAIALGIGASVLAESPYPFLGTLAMCSYLVYQYERALRKGTDEGPGLDIRSGAG